MRGYVIAGGSKSLIIKYKRIQKWYYIINKELILHGGIKMNPAYHIARISKNIFMISIL